MINEKTLYGAITSNSEISETAKKYLHEICIATDGINQLYEIIFQHKIDPTAEFIILKSIAIEIHNIYILLPGASLNKKIVDKIYGIRNLVEIRNSICHVDQRINMKSKAPKSAEKKLQWETKSIAGGLAKSTDGGKNWTTTAKKIFNFEIHGRTGARTTVGQLDDYLVCQSDLGSIYLNLNRVNFDDFYAALIARVEAIRTDSAH